MIFGRVLGFLDRLVAEELAPAVEALALEVQRDPQVQLMGRQFAADLGDQELAEFLTEHRSPRSHHRATAAVARAMIASTTSVFASAYCWTNCQSRAASSRFVRS